MSAHAFFVTSSQVAMVANDNGPGRSAADVHMLPPQVCLPARTHRLDTIFFVEDGVVEFMIAGAAAMVGSGTYIRVPANVLFACRNAGDDTARLVSRQVPAGRQCGTRITVDIAAA